MNEHWIQGTLGDLHSADWIVIIYCIGLNGLITSAISKGLISYHKVISKG